MTDFTRLSLLDVADAVNARRRRAEDVAAEALARVAAYEAIQPAVWISRVPAKAVLAAARAVDARIAAGERLALAGIPFAVKDNIDVAGIPTTGACPAFAYTPDASATAVDRLRAPTRPVANWSRLVLPRTIAPASSRRWTTGAVSAGA